MMLEQSAERIIELISQAKAIGSRQVISLVGPNGSGKTRLLQRVKEHFSTDKNCVFISVERANIMNFFHYSSGAYSSIADPTKDLESVTREIVAMLAGEESRLAPYGQASITSVFGILCMAIDAIDKETLENRRKEIDRLDMEAVDIRKPVYFPPRPKLIMEDVEKFLSDVFDYECKIMPPNATRQGHSFEIKFSSSEATFGLEGLSSGERQILLLSIISLTTHPKDIVLLIDEPELFLNEARAVEVWGKVEDAFPHASFVYATHNLVFATRSRAIQAFALNKKSDLEKIDINRPFPADKLRQIVGARVQLLRSNLPPVFCEDGMAKLLLEDLIEPGTAEIVPLAGCTDVVAAMSGERHWHLLRSSGGTACGVVDLDQRSNENVASLANKGVFCLGVNEAEAILIEPKFLSRSLSKSLEKNIEEDECIEYLLDAAKHRLRDNIEILSFEVARQNAPRITFNTNDSSVVDVSVSSSENLKEIFESRAHEFSNAIKNKNVDTILKLFGSKEMYDSIKSLIFRKYKYQLPKPDSRYRDHRELIRSTIAEISWANDIKSKILSRIGSPSR